jgi:alpha-beta hydrolase superfamily lysophospholipase
MGTRADDLHTDEYSTLDQPSAIRTRKRYRWQRGMKASRLGGDISLSFPRTREAGALIATTLCDPRSPKVIDDFSVNAFVGRVMLPISRHTPRWASGLRLPIRWFSKMKAIANDEGLVEVICNDPLGGGARPPLGFLLSIFEVRPDLEPEAFDLCPVLFMHPAEDHWTSLDASKGFFDRLASRDKEFTLLEGCGHFPLEEPGITQLERRVHRFLDRLFRRH